MKCYQVAVTILAVCASNGAIANAECAGVGAVSIPVKFIEAQKICASSVGYERDADASTNSLAELPRWTAVQYGALRHPSRPRRIEQHNTRLAIPQPSQPTAGVIEVSQRYRIDPLLLDAIVMQESHYRTGAISAHGALGLMQVMPATARMLGVTEPRQMLSDPGFALATGAAYLKTLQSRFGNNVPLVLAAYNSGPGAVLRFGGIPRYAETRGYVATIMQRYQAARLSEIGSVPR